MVCSMCEKYRAVIVGFWLQSSLLSASDVFTPLATISTGAIHGRVTLPSTPAGLEGPQSTRGRSSVELFPARTMTMCHQQKRAPERYCRRGGCGPNHFLTVGGTTTEELQYSELYVLYRYCSVFVFYA